MSLHDMVHDPETDPRPLSRCRLCQTTPPTPLNTSLYIGWSDGQPLVNDRYMKALFACHPAINLHPAFRETILARIIQQVVDSLFEQVIIHIYFDCPKHVKTFPLDVE